MSVSVSERESERGTVHSLLRGLGWFLQEKANDKEVWCRFCGGQDGDGHLFFFLGLHLHPFSLPPSILPVVCCGMVAFLV